MSSVSHWVSLYYCYYYPYSNNYLQTQTHTHIRIYIHVSPLSVCLVVEFLVVKKSRWIVLISCIRLNDRSSTEWICLTLTKSGVRVLRRQLVQGGENKYQSCLAVAAS